MEKVPVRLAVARTSMLVLVVASKASGVTSTVSYRLALKATLAGLVLIFLGWVAFATVNVVFKDRIIAAKDNRFQQMH